MRNAVTISLPPKMTTLVKKQVKSGQYASTSEFFRNLIRLWEEEQIALAVAESKKEFIAGKGRKLKSLRDLR
ncbi:MAG: type II toxin-antitoxin system ParD family antitoxin [Candidatus Magasanikbacteria bacterium]|nr:type II toxin-antitoxin system ParD family antitoxin [Candidatus Magasanikbacteria bacterium]